MLHTRARPSEAVVRVAAFGPAPGALWGVAHVIFNCTSVADRRASLLPPPARLPPPAVGRAAMAAQGSHEGFLAELRPVLHRAFCLHSFPSESVERHNKPIIEVAGEGSPLVLPPVTVSRSAQVRRGRRGSRAGLLPEAGLGSTRHAGMRC